MAKGPSGVRAASKTASAKGPGFNWLTIWHNIHSEHRLKPKIKENPAKTTVTLGVRHTCPDCVLLEWHQNNQQKRAQTRYQKEFSIQSCYNLLTEKPSFNCLFPHLSVSFWLLCLYCCHTQLLASNKCWVIQHVSWFGIQKSNHTIHLIDGIKDKNHTVISTDNMKKVIWQNSIHLVTKQTKNTN